MTKTAKKLRHRSFLNTPLHSTNPEILHQTYRRWREFFCTLSEVVAGSEEMSYNNSSSSKSCVKLPPRNIVNIIFSAFLNCEFCDRYSSKFTFKVSNSYLREYLFVALQSYVFFPLLNYCCFFCLFLFSFSLFFSFQ